MFVGAVEHLATSLGIDELLLALVIAPIATELPEKFNSLIWVRQGKDTLAMGNITGAMVFQSAIPTVVALLFAADAWHFEDGSRIAFLSAGIAFLATAAIFVPMARSHRLTGRRLLVGGAFYLVYLAVVPGRPGRILIQLEASADAALYSADRQTTPARRPAPHVQPGAPPMLTQKTTDGARRRACSRSVRRPRHRRA